MDSKRLEKNDSDFKAFNEESSNSSDELRSPDNRSQLDDNKKTQKTDTLNSHDTPSDILDEIPPELRDVLEKGQISTQAITSLFMASAGAINPLTKHIKPEHITELINLWNKDTDYNYDIEKRQIEFEKGSRWFHLSIYSLALAFIIFIIIFLSSSNPTLLQNLLNWIIAGLGGLGGGGYLVYRSVSKRYKLKGD